MFIFVFKQLKVLVSESQSSDIDICWNNTDFRNHSFPSSWHDLHQSFESLLAVSMTLLLFVWWLVNIRLRLDHVPEIFSGVQVLRLAWLWHGLDLVVLHSQLDWRVCGMEHCAAGKSNPQSWGTSEQKDDLVHAFICASFTEINPSFAEPRQGHHRPWDKTPWQADFSKCLSNHNVLAKA